MKKTTAYENTSHSNNKRASRRVNYVFLMIIEAVSKIFLFLKRIKGF